MASDKNSIILNAQRLTAKGEIDKAIDTWKSLIAETPNDGNIYNTIGDLYIKKTAQAQAIEAFLKAGTTFQTAGFALKTIAVYKKIIKLDPGRMDVVLKLADVNAERGIVGNAVEDYLKVARHELKEGRVKAGIAVYRKIAALDPANPTIGLKLAELCQKEGLVDEAREELSRVAGQLEKAGKTAELSQIRAKLTELGGAGASPEVTSAPPPPVAPSVGSASPAAEPPLAAVPEFVLETTSQPSAGRSAGSMSEATAAAEPVPPRGGEETFTPVENIFQAPAAAPESARVKSVSEYDETTHERMTDALTEADVYVKYGMIDKGIAHLLDLAKRDPGHLGVHLKLKELYILQGDAKAAAEVCGKIASLYQVVGQDAEREAILAEALELLPDQSPPAGACPPSAPPVSSVEEPVFDGPPIETSIGAAAPEAAGDTLDQDLAEADFYFQQGFDDEARRLFGAILKKAPGHPIATERLRELAARGPSAAPTEDLEATSHTIEQPLEETSLGADIAVGAIEPVEAAAPRGETTKEEEYIDLVDALREDMERSIPPQEEAELSQELSAERELESVFRKFQKGVQEQYGKEDYETHYNLGIAYREMGLLNEAIGEFRLVLKSPDRVIPATSMLAVCYREKGLLPRAEEALLEVLNNPRYAGAPGVAGLAYELGQIFEVLGRYDDALTQYYRVRDAEPNHQEAAGRISHLERRNAAPTPPPLRSVPPPPKTEAPRAPAKPARQDQKKKVSYL